MTTIERLKEIAREQLEWTGELPSGPIVEEFDSLQLMTLVVAVEDAFQIELDPEEEEQIGTIADLVSLIEEKQNG